MVRTKDLKLACLTVTVSIPRPSGVEPLQPRLAVCIQFAFAVKDALINHPSAKQVAVCRLVRRPDSGVTVVFDEVAQVTERLLPLIGAGFPCPGGMEILQPYPAVRI